MIDWIVLFSGCCILFGLIIVSIVIDHVGLSFTFKLVLPRNIPLINLLQLFHSWIF